MSDTRIAQPPTTPTDRAYRALGALRSSIQRALQQLDGGDRADRIARELREGMELAEGLRTGTAPASCPVCGRHIELTAERALVRRVGRCGLCAEEAMPLESVGVFTTPAQFDAWLMEESTRG